MLINLLWKQEEKAQLVWLMDINIEQKKNKGWSQKRQKKKGWVQNLVYLSAELFFFVTR